MPYSAPLYNRPRKRRDLNRPVVSGSPFPGSRFACQDNTRRDEGRQDHHRIAFARAYVRVLEALTRNRSYPDKMNPNEGRLPYRSSKAKFIPCGQLTTFYSAGPVSWLSRLRCCYPARPWCYVLVTMAMLLSSGPTKTRIAITKVQVRAELSIHT